MLKHGPITACIEYFAKQRAALSEVSGILPQASAPTLIVCGKNDHIFAEAGAHAYKKDLKNIDINLYDTGHFALETHGKEIADKIRGFLDKHAEK